MEDTLINGDVVLVWKNVKIEKNDVFVFKGKKDKYYIKRCIGFPGDTLFRVNNLLFINSKPVFLPNESKETYKVYFNNRDLAFVYFDNLGIRFQNNYNMAVPEPYVLVNISKVDKEISLEKSFIDSISLYYDCNTTANLLEDKLELLPNGIKTVIPKLESNQPTNIIDFKESSQHLSKVNEIHTVITNKKKVMAENHYFVMGDNRNFSIDSRHFGPIPESSIVGKANYVLFSWSKNNPFFISRIFMKIK